MSSKKSKEWGEKTSEIAIELAKHQAMDKAMEIAKENVVPVVLPAAKAAAPVVGILGVLVAINWIWKEICDENGWDPFDHSF
jgi:hypothetical protein